MKNKAAIGRFILWGKIELVALRELLLNVLTSS